MFTLTAQDKHGILIAGKLPGNHDQNSRVYDTNGLAPTLSTMQGGGQEPKIIQRGHGYNQGEEHKIAPTLLVVGDVYFYNYANQKDFSKLKEFLETENNQATFARAWLDGYTVEEEKRYLVKMKATGQYLRKDENSIRFSSFFISDFTRNDIEDLGFGWVFDCPGIEIEEVL